MLLSFLMLPAAAGAEAAGAADAQDSQTGSTGPEFDAAFLKETARELAERHGADHLARAMAGVERVAALWRESDGDRRTFLGFVRKQFIADEKERRAAHLRLEAALESIYGHMHQISRDLRTPIDLDLGPISGLDGLLARFSPPAHVAEDFFRQKIAHFLALNFPHYTLGDKLRDGGRWDRRRWAMARLGDLFTERAPAKLSLRIHDCQVTAAEYVYDYNIFMGRLLTPGHERLFPEGLRLIEHWGLRDEIRAQYNAPGGLQRQELIYQVMLRIIDQSIPAQVINSDRLWWEPGANRLFGRRGDTFVALGAPHRADQRYERLRAIFEAYTLLDPYFPHNPTVMDRVFNLNRQLPEETMERLLVSVLASPEALRVGALIAKRLGRPLRPFDIWYKGFQPRGRWDEEELDRIVGKRFPSRDAFQGELVGLLERYGFKPETARFLGERIVVDASRGAGHAMPAAMRVDQSHLRTRIPREGMRYKGFNIALHELGHTVEQVFSLHCIDYYALRGVPNSAFTEAVAIMFQNRDLQILGLEEPSLEAADLQTLDTFWCTMESGGVGLVEMRIWRWMYAHPEASAGELGRAVVQIAKDVWNAYFAPVIGVADSPVLAVYAHMLSHPTYLPNYPMGHIILYQIEDALSDKDFATEIERICRLGKLTPSLWMQQAVGADISTTPLIEAAKEVLDRLEQK